MRTKKHAAFDDCRQTEIGDETFRIDIIDFEMCSCVLPSGVHNPVELQTK